MNKAKQKTPHSFPKSALSAETASKVFKVFN